MTPSKVHYTQYLKVLSNLSILKVQVDIKEQFTSIADALISQELDRTHIQLLNKLSHLVESQLGTKQRAR